MRELEAMPLAEVVRFVEEPVTTELNGPSGRKYRCKTYSFWDMEPEASDLFVKTTVKGRGRAVLQRYQGTDVRAPDGSAERVEDGPDVSPTYVAALWQAGCFATAIGVFVALLGGFAYAVSRVIRWL